MDKSNKSSLWAALKDHTGYVNVTDMCSNCRHYTGHIDVDQSAFPSCRRHEYGNMPVLATGLCDLYERVSR